MNDYFFVNNRTGAGLSKIMLSDIIYIEAAGDYVDIVTVHKTHTFHSTLKRMDEFLPKGLFYRAHRSYSINLDRVESIVDNNVILLNATKEIPIGEQYKKDLLAKINYFGSTAELKGEEKGVTDSLDNAKKKKFSIND